MSDTKKSKPRGVGRPPAGRKAYLIRMKPATHAMLVRAARNTGCPTIGAFIEYAAEMGAL